MYVTENLHRQYFYSKRMNVLSTTNTTTTTIRNEQKKTAAAEKSTMEKLFKTHPLYKFKPIPQVKIHTTKKTTFKG